MRLKSKVVYKVLKENGVNCIYHANSVITSCQFLRKGALLSRSFMEENGLFQTPQYTDKIDKKYGIWNDIFTDSVDIHGRASRYNKYGPVLFVFEIEILNDLNGEVWVTKLNPTKWVGKTDEERWFTSGKDLQENLVKGEFDQMVVFRNCDGKLPFWDYLSQIILDDPILKAVNKVDFFSRAYGALQLAMTERGMAIPIKRRKCLSRCTCVEDYHTNKDHTRTMYSIKI